MSDRSFSFGSGLFMATERALRVSMIVMHPGFLDKLFISQKSRLLQQGQAKGKCQTMEPLREGKIQKKGTLRFPRKLYSEDRV